jgi:hypothetical protein
LFFPAGGKDVGNNDLAMEKIQGRQNESPLSARKHQEFPKWSGVLYLRWVRSHRNWWGRQRLEKRDFPAQLAHIHGEGTNQKR